MISQLIIDRETLTFSLYEDMDQDPVRQYTVAELCAFLEWSIPGVEMPDYDADAVLVTRSETGEGLYEQPVQMKPLDELRTSEALEYAGPWLLRMAEALHHKLKDKFTITLL